MAGRKQPPRLNPECKTCLTALTGDNWTPSMQKYRRYVCKSCWADRQAGYAKKDPKHKEKKQIKRVVRESEWSEDRRNKEYERRKCRYLQKTYGITFEKYTEMLRGQGFQCKICGTLDAGGKGVFHVDHCHSSGKIRGLLCVNCNMMLGLVYDKTDVLMKAINYLEETNEYPVHTG